MSKLSKKIKCSVGVFAYNEERNIGTLLEALLGQELKRVEIDEIIVVASGCTDNTVQIAKQFAQRQSPTIEVLVQEKREGKVAAINLFLREANNATVLLESGDTIPEKNTVEYLIVPFADDRVGMTGARPVPVDKPHSLMGFTTNLLWSLHHKIALEDPKMGEMVAFRKDLVPELPLTSVDEALIEAKVKKTGLEVRYVPDAIVYNKGPETARDFLKQRRRIHAGHLHLRRYWEHEVSTGSIRTILKALRKYERKYVRTYVYMPAAIALEAIGKALGYWDFYILKKDHIAWDIAGSTKTVNIKRP